MLVALVILLVGCAGGGSSTSKTGGEQSQVSASFEQGKERQSKTEKLEVEAASTTFEDAFRTEQPSIVPVTLEIPAIDVSTTVEKTGVLPDGRMGVPKDTDNVAWFAPGSMPGERGNAVMAGHVDDLVSPAVFYDLKKLKVGDQVFVTGDDGEKLTFEVTRKETYPRLDAPLDNIFGSSYAKRLNLITCVGKYDPKTTERADRLVVFTELVES